MRIIVVAVLLLALVAGVLGGCAPQESSSEPVAYTSVVLEDHPPKPRCTDLPPTKALALARAKR